MAQQELAMVEMDDIGDGTNCTESDIVRRLIGLGLGIAVPMPPEWDGEDIGDLIEPGEVTGDRSWDDEMLWSGYLQ